MVRAELGRLRERGRREGRRQLSARVLRARHGGDAGPGFAWIRRNRIPVLARIDPGLRLARQAESFSGRVTDGLVAAGIGFWWLPYPDRPGQILCLRAEDRTTALRVVGELATSSWYADLLSPTGERRGQLLAAAALAGGRADAAAGLRLWEYVAPAAQSGFLADEQQGLLIHFWVAGRGDDLETPVAGGLSDEDGAGDSEPVEGDGSEAGVRPSAEPDSAVTDDQVVLRSSVANLVATVLDPEDCVGFGLVPPPLRNRQIATVDFPIDVVYTWVDGSDPAWLQTKAAAIGGSDDQSFTERAQDDSRFADHDELRFSLRALQQFAPWVNHVWIVTADQHPAWLAPDDPWISVVPHREIFPDPSALPTFNSHAIEACLHRIPGLAEHFLYLNDDMILGRPLVPEQFFHPSGIGKFFSSRALVDYRANVPGEIASSTAAKNARALLGERYGVTFARKFFHTAAALHVSELSSLESEFADAFEATRRATFRTVHDIAVAGSFYLNYGYLAGTLTPSRLRYDYVDPAGPDAAWRMRRLLRQRSFDAFCINDGSTAEDTDQRRRTDRVIRRFLADYLPVPGSFEV